MKKQQTPKRGWAHAPRNPKLLLEKRKRKETRLAKGRVKRAEQTARRRAIEAIEAEKLAREKAAGVEAQPPPLGAPLGAPLETMTTQEATT